MTEQVTDALVIPEDGSAYVSKLSFDSLGKFFTSRSAIILGGAIGAGYQITLFHDPKSTKEWNYVASQLVCWLQSPSSSFDQALHGPVVMFNERNGELQALKLQDLENLTKLVDQRERGAEQALQEPPQRKMSMKRGSYLENYLESVSALPGELKRNFQLMRELDTRTQENLEEVEQLQRLYGTLARKNGKAQDDEEASSLVDRIRHQFQECIDVADEKVSVAVQTYELVDKHIRRLDTDLKKFEAELDQISLTAPPVVPMVPTEPQRKGGRTVPAAAGGAGQKKDDPKRKSTEPVLVNTPLKRAPDARVLQVDLDMPIDPNEPTYCICNRVSFGEMVGCDNAEPYYIDLRLRVLLFARSAVIAHVPDLKCPTEWFHFDCVGLTGPPKGKWYCADCSATMKNKMKK